MNAFWTYRDVAVLCDIERLFRKWLMDAHGGSGNVCNRYTFGSWTDWL
jgi:hypothetical protein